MGVTKCGRRANERTKKEAGGSFDVSIAARSLCVCVVTFAQVQTIGRLIIVFAYAAREREQKKESDAFFSSLSFWSPSFPLFLVA